MANYFYFEKPAELNSCGSTLLLKHEVLSEIHILKMADTISFYILVHNNANVSMVIKIIYVKL